MSFLKKTYVIVGNGVAGLTAAQEIRKIDQDSRIKIISEDQYLTYYRVKLSHFISKDFSVEDLLIHDASWYRERNIDVYLDSKVKTIDPLTSKVILENGEEIPYDKLLIATGGSSFVPPVKEVNKKGVFTLRNLGDLQNIQNYLKTCNEVTVIGGGLLGLEAAWALKERGLTVNVVEFFPYLLPKQLDEELANHVKKKLEDEGLKIHLSASTQEILGEDKAKAVLLQDGRKITSDMVLFSAGVRPNLDLLKGTNVTTNKGILVNDRMQTSVENIYAAGDVVEFQGTMMPLWSTATEQGKIAGKAMTGEIVSYSPPQPATLLTIGKLSVFSVGEINDKKQFLSYRQGDVFHKLFIDEGKLIGGVLTGDIKKMVALKKAVNAKVDLSNLLQQNTDLLEILNKI